MNGGGEAGFTLTEMLVALLVLGVTASAMSTSMGTAFNSYEHLSDVSEDMHVNRQLHSVFTDVSNSFWLKNGSIKELNVTALELSHAHFQKLEIVKDNESWKLLAYTRGFDAVDVYHSEQPLRFIAHGVKPLYNSGKRSDYDYQTISLQEQNSDWVQVISVPLKVDADPECRFDIVGRRCR